uniref:Reverse transcriptase n=1 Tax=Cannabis sativa TaxID=3483 RepID=A0A803PIQ3_CANSA
MPEGLNATNIVLIPKKKKPDQMKKAKWEGWVYGVELDLSKAYDRVDWHFLCAMLYRLGFDDKWVRLIFGCLSSVQYNVATACEVANIQHMLDVFAKALGQQVNFAKSSVFFSSNTSSHMRQTICNRMGIQEADEKSKYLGLPSTIGRNKTAAFSYVVDKVHKRVQTWDNKFLSKAGKEVLIKSVVQALPAYTMNVFLLPISICDDVERAISKFWWKSNKNKGIHWLSWDKLSSHKMNGGMCFRDFRDFNLSLLAKQGWRLLTCEDSLVTKIFKARYFAHGNFLTASLGSNPSYIWRSLWESQDLVVAGVRRLVGDGSRVSILKDPWLKDDVNPFIESSHPEPNQQNGQFIDGS